MCDYCSHVLNGVIVSHKVINCPYRKSMYCYICAANGHIVDDCPNKVAKAVRQGLPTKGIQNITLTIPSSDDGIKDFLKAKGLIEKNTYITQFKSKALLRDYANSLKPPHMIFFT
jgi:hypothetical protein